MSNQRPSQAVQASVRYLTVTEDEQNQRLDNYLIARLKGVPKSRIYRLVRKGEVRVNKKRAGVDYRLHAQDEVRLPPVRLAPPKQNRRPSAPLLALLQNSVLYEDQELLIINKPSGLAVHAGSTVKLSLIDAMKALYPKFPHLELAHRLDTETSGCLILAKKRLALKAVHELLREGAVHKTYLALVAGCWPKSLQCIDVPLRKDYRDGGKHVVYVDMQHGKAATTLFETIATTHDVSLLKVSLLTGRTHQIRVHAAFAGHPLLGDDRYGHQVANQKARELGLTRLFLHAAAVSFVIHLCDQTE